MNEIFISRTEKTKHISYDDPILVCIHNNKTDEMKVSLGWFRESHREPRKNIAVHHVTVLSLEVTINQTTRAVELQQKTLFVVCCDLSVDSDFVCVVAASGIL